MPIVVPATLPLTPSTVQWMVEVDADPDTTGEFVLDSSALDGPDLLGPDTRWIDVGQVVRKISIRRGRNDDSRPYDAAEAVVEFDNRTGDFDSDNPYGRYVMLGIRKMLGVGTGLRVKALTGAFVSTVTDSFNRANATGSLGAADTGEVWTSGAAFNIASSKAASNTGGVNYATVSTGGLALSVSVAIVEPGTTYSGPVIRYVDNNNTYLVKADGVDLRLYRRIAGVEVQLGIATGVWTGSGTVGITATETTTTTDLVVSRNGSTVITYSDSAVGRPAGFRAGFQSFVSGVTFDDFTATGEDSTGIGAVFTGVVENPAVTDDPFVPTATYTSVDLMASLANIQVPLQSEARGTGETSSDRAKWLLDEAAVPTSLRSVADFGRQVLGTTGEGSIRDALQKVANGEGGRFYVNRTGAVTLTWHDAEFLRTSVASFNDNGSALRYTALDVSPGTTGVTNTVNVKRTGPRVRNPETGEFERSVDIPDVVAADDDSVATYGRRQEDIECVLLNDDDALSLATYRATRRAQPVQRLTRLTPQPLEALSAADAQTILDLDIGSLITVVRHTVDGRELTFVVTVEGINIDAVPGVTRVTLFTAPADTTGVYAGTGWFVLDTSALDGLDVLAPF